MTTWARILGDEAVDVTTSDPTETFHPDVASSFVQVPDGTAPGSWLIDGAWVAPTPLEAPDQATTPIIDVPGFMMRLGLAKLAAVLGNPDHELQAGMAVLQRASHVDLSEPFVKEAADRMVALNLISAEDEATLLAWEPV